MFDLFLESSQWDNSNKWLNIGFGEEIMLEVKCQMMLILCILSGALLNRLPNSLKQQQLQLFKEHCFAKTK